MITLVVIDMQVGTFSAPTPQHDADGVIARINRLATAIRRKGGKVIYVQHDGAAGNTYEPGTPGWDLIPELERENNDPVVNKRACDAFYETRLKELLDEIETTRLVIAGSASDFCVDTTIRAAASHDFEVTVVKDGHTTCNRPHLDAARIIEHHNRIWQDLTLPRSRIEVIDCDELLADI